MTTRPLRFTFFLLIYLTLSLTATAQVVDIPDPNLRAAVETALGKASGATITVSDMTRLTRFHASRSNISDLTGLEHATNLIGLALWENNISDISPLAGLINLIGLALWGNSISDISPLAGLTHLTDLNLERNSISDISPLVANTGLGSGDFVAVWDNPLSPTSIKTHIPTLQSRGVSVGFTAVTFDDTVNPDTPVTIPDPNLRAVIAGSSWQSVGCYYHRVGYGNFNPS